MGIIYYFCPDYPPPSGGTMTLYRHVHQLNRLGCVAKIIHHHKGFKLSWHGYEVPILSLEELPQFTKNDVVVISEGSCSLMKKSKEWQCSIVIIALNWWYIYQALPPDEDWNHFGITRVITPSPKTKDFVEWSMNIKTDVIYNYIDTKKYQYILENKKLKISYMSRKSPNGDILWHILRNKETLKKYEWCRLADYNEAVYAKHLNESKIYLATTSHEGANVSVLEAMSAGCIVIGFAGFGGLDYMVGEGENQNCILIEDENIFKLGKAVEIVANELENDSTKFQRMVNNGIKTAQQFNDSDREAESLKHYFEQLIK